MWKSFDVKVGGAVSRCHQMFTAASRKRGNGGMRCGKKGKISVAITKNKGFIAELSIWASLTVIVVWGGGVWLKAWPI